MKLKKADYAAIGFLALYALLVIFFPLTVQTNVSFKLDPNAFGASASRKIIFGALGDGLKNFGDFTQAFPYIMGFFKVGLLATFGEMLKNRRKNGEWKVPSLFWRFIVWGMTGVVFTAVFALFGAGIPALMQKGLLCTADNASFNNVLRAFFTSFFMNMIFAYPMMLAHEYFNEVINRKKFIGGGEFLSSINAHIWGSFIPKTILYFWVPAHTITFLLPENYRVLASALLALVLGFLLTFHAPKTPAKAE